MDKNAYFETDPWSNAVETVEKGLLGNIVAVSIKVVCESGKISGAVNDWQSKLDTLLGQPANRDVLQNQNAVSILLKYQNGVIARVFIDDSYGETTTDFEIVGTGSLLIWKPDVHALSILSSSNGQEAIYEHPFPDSLKKEEVS